LFSFPVKGSDHPVTQRPDTRSGRQRYDSKNQRESSEMRIRKIRENSPAAINKKYWNSMSFSVGILPHLEKEQPLRRSETINTKKYFQKIFN